MWVCLFDSKMPTRIVASILSGNGGDILLSYCIEQCACLNSLERQHMLPILCCSTSLNVRVSN